MPRKRQRGKLDLRGFVVPLVLLMGAQLAAMADNLQSDSLARPSAIFVAGFHALIEGAFFRATGQTLTAALSGLAIGGSAGLLLGIALGRWRVLDRIMFVSVELLRPMPPIALMPLALLVFGFGYSQEISIVAFATIWPALILTRAAVQNIDQQLIEVTRLLQLTPWHAAVKVLLPTMLPRLLVALRISLGIAIVVAVAVEIILNPLGLGHAMMDAQQTLHPALAFAFLIWIGLVGWLLNATIVWLQNVCNPQRRGVPL